MRVQSGSSGGGVSGEMSGEVSDGVNSEPNGELNGRYLSTRRQKNWVVADRGNPC